MGLATGRAKGKPDAVQRMILQGATSNEHMPRKA